MQIAGTKTAVEIESEAMLADIKNNEDTTNPYVTQKKSDESGKAQSPKEH